MTGRKRSPASLALAFALAGITTSPATEPGWVERLTVWMTPKVQTIDKQLSALTGELTRLPEPAGTSSGIRRGFQTGRIKAGEELWVELILPKPSAADQVILIPLLAKGTQGQVPGYGFPKRFQLEALDTEGEVHLLLDETADNFPNPGLFPVIAPCPPGVKLTQFRLTATEPWNRGGPQVLALAEMLILDGNRNLASGGKVNSSSSREMAPTWSRENLIDLVTPLGLPLTKAPSTSLGWHSDVARGREVTKSVTLDLGRSVDLDEVRLAPAWQPKLPENLHYGFPSQFIIEGSATPDFGNASVIHDQTTQSLLSPGQNIQNYPVTGPPLRYLRITATRLRERSGEFVFALGEVQAYAQGENVALGATVLSEESQEDREWGRAKLTDGFSSGNQLLEFPAWFQGLDRRRILIRQQGELLAEREELVGTGRQKLVGGSIGATGGIGILASVLLWRARSLRRLDREKHRERLARDLHDELGSNLGSIALISSFAKEDDVSKEQMRHDLNEIEIVARESADSMREMVELLGGGHRGISNDWLNVMAGMAKRLLREVKLDCQLPVRPMLVEPRLETRREIYLFCKEVLYNIAKHSHASRVQFHLHPKPNGLRIEITDNGCGFDSQIATGGQGIGNLRERARRLQATMNLTSSREAGTTVTLDIPRTRHWQKPSPHNNS